MCCWVQSKLHVNCLVMQPAPNPAIAVPKQLWVAQSALKKSLFRAPVNIAEHTISSAEHYNSKKLGAMGYTLFLNDMGKGTPIPEKRSK